MRGRCGLDAKDSKFKPSKAVTNGCHHSTSFRFLASEETSHQNTISNHLGVFFFRFSKKTESFQPGAHLYLCRDISDHFGSNNCVLIEDQCSSNIVVIWWPGSQSTFRGSKVWLQAPLAESMHETRNFRSGISQLDSTGPP